MFKNARIGLGTGSTLTLIIVINIISSLPVLAGLNETAQSNAALAETISATTEELSGQARDPDTLMNYFRIDLQSLVPYNDRQEETA